MKRSYSVVVEVRRRDGSLFVWERFGPYWTRAEAEAFRRGALDVTDGSLCPPTVTAEIEEEEDQARDLADDEEGWKR